MVLVSSDCKKGTSLEASEQLRLSLQGAGAQVKDRMERVASGEGLRPVLLFPEVLIQTSLHPVVKMFSSFLWSKVALHYRYDKLSG